MAKKYLIGVDLGTSGTKAALYQIDGVKIAEASVEVPLYYPKPGIVEQETGDFYDTAAQTIRQCVEQSGIDRAGDRSHRLRFADGRARDRSTRITGRPRASTPGWTCAASRTSSGWTGKPATRSPS